MTIFVINRTNSKVQEESETPLFWTSVLLAEKAIIMSESGSLFKDDLFVDMDPKILRGYFKEIYLILDKNMSAQKLEKFLNLYIRLKNEKRKNHDKIILYMKAKSMLNDLIKFCKNGIAYYLEYYILDKLAPFYKKKILEYKPLDEYDLNETEPGKILKGIADLICSSNELPIFDYTFEENYAMGIEVKENVECNEAKNIFFKTNILRLPAIYNLESAPAEILRNEIRYSLNFFLKKIEDISAELLKLDFIANNYNVIGNLVKDNLLPELSHAQSIIDSNIYIQQMRSEFDEEFDLNLFLGVTSIRNILYYYKSMGIISEKGCLYIMEKCLLIKEPDKCKTFLYLNFRKDSISSMRTILKKR